MAQLSRTKKYEELRNQLEEETTAAQAKTTPSRLSRMQANNLSHASQPVHRHEEIRVKPMAQELPKSPVMDDLLDEVKQYNLNNGYRYTDDTQINILKQLDGDQTKKRNSHFIPMEEEDETLGSTMQMPTTKAEDVDGVATYMPNQKLTRINPVTTTPRIEPELIPDEEEEEVVLQPERIVLSNSDIRADEMKEESDELSFFNTNQDEFDRTLDNQSMRLSKKQPKKVKAKKKAKKETKEALSEDVPSAKMRMKAGDIENEPAKKSQKKSGTILNVILVILILLLLGSIGVTVYFLMQMGM